MYQLMQITNHVTQCLVPNSILLCTQSWMLSVING